MARVMHAHLTCLSCFLVALQGCPGRGAAIARLAADLIQQASCQTNWGRSLELELSSQALPAMIAPWQAPPACGLPVGFALMRWFAPVIGCVAARPAVQHGVAARTCSWLYEEPEPVPGVRYSSLIRS